MEKTNPTTNTALQIKRTYTASREKVFRAWTEPDALKKWCAPTDEFSVLTAEVDLHVGGKYRIAMKAPDGNLHVAIGTYREILSPQKLVFTWTWEGSDMPDTLVTLDFHERGAATELVLTHEFFPNVEQRDKHQHGWTGCLERLGKLLNVKGN